MRLFYYIHPVGNFGDDLSPDIVQYLLGQKIETVKKHEIGKSKRFEKFFFSLGSIFHFVQNGDVVWGTGVNIVRKNPKTLKKVDIRAIRGPLSRDFILKNYDIDCPAIFGDPALLLPELFPDLRPAPIRKYVIIPHGGDIDFFRSYENVVLPTLHWKTVLEMILGSEMVISSGLHGIILAEAFGVPARWLRNEALPSYHNEGVFKYNDYFLSTERSPDDWAESIEDALKIGGKEPITVNFNSLYASFPRDVFSLRAKFFSRLGFIFDTLFSKIIRR